MELTKSQVALLRDIAGSQTEEGYTEYEPASVDEDWKYSIDVLVHGNLIYNPYEGEEDDDRMKYCLSALGNIECALRGIDTSHIVRYGEHVQGHPELLVITEEMEQMSKRMLELYEVATGVANNYRTIETREADSFRLAVNKIQSTLLLSKGHSIATVGRIGDANESIRKLLTVKE